MESLSQLSASTFHSSQVFGSPSVTRRFEAFEISVAGSVGQFTQVHVEESALSRWGSTDATVSQDASSETTTAPEASFKVVRLERNIDISLNVSRDSFHALFDAMGADPAVLYLICRDYDGFHDFPGRPGYRPTWFYGAATHAIMWTFDKTSTLPRTVAIYFERRANLFPAFGEVLCTFRNYASVSQLLLLLIPVHQMHRYDDDAAVGLDKIRKIESVTGFGPHHELVKDPPESTLQFRRDPYFSASNFDIDVLTGFSQRVNEVAGNISNRLRHQRVLQTMLENLQAEAARTGTLPLNAASYSSPSSQDVIRLLNVAVPVVLNRLTTNAEYLTYLRDRSERLSSVIFALLTHQDAAASIELGIASKRDTSSMKTVAIVTMAFLPATFIAALFAVPSLDWAGKKVISSRFWVYWAFTVPITAFVFAIWLVITERQWLVGRLAVFRTSESRLEATCIK